MGYREYLNREVTVTYYTKEVAIKRFKYIIKYCEKKEIPAKVSVSYNNKGQYYNVFVHVNEYYVSDIKDLLYCLDLK